MLLSCYCPSNWKLSCRVRGDSAWFYREPFRVDMDRLLSRMMSWSRSGATVSFHASTHGWAHVVAKHADRNTWVASVIPPCVTFKAPLARKATGNHLINSTSLGKLRALYPVSASLEIEYATQQLVKNS